jgi:hypothetical protein
MGSDRATVEALPPDAVGFALDLSQNRIITIEDRQIPLVDADTGRSDIFRLQAISAGREN